MLTTATPKTKLSGGAALVRRAVGRVVRTGRLAFESVVYGGRGRERLLVGLLGSYYTSRFRRDWLLSRDLPHFFNQRITFFNFAFTGNCRGPFALSRGFYASEVVREGDRVLDIGCGDGFFTRRFLAERAAAVDALDVEPSAITAAERYNPCPKVRYYLRDAVDQPFPATRYDVIVWDGAIGHFPPDVLGTMLRKIADSLAPDGVFVGSESLGMEGHDHLQYFETLDDLRSVFARYFPCVALREQSYRIGHGGDAVRREAYWRCAHLPDRLRECRWE
jgi:SAM-dependent methyltransferase